jgi:hypothetical protein
MTYIAPPYSWGVGVTILLYLFSVAHLMTHLERKHPEAWASMGSPLMRFHPGLGNWLPLMGAIFFGLQIGLPADTGTQGRVWLVRGLALFCFALIAIGYSTNLLPRD